MVGDPIVTTIIANPLFSALAFVVGLGVGHWLALGRDKRRERNDAAQMVREPLIRELGNLSPHSKRPDIVDVDLLEQCLPFWQRRRFRRAFDRYKKNCGRWQQDASGDDFYDQATVSEIVVDIRALLHYAKHQ